MTEQWKRPLQSKNARTGEQSTDWLDALASDAQHVTMIINRIEFLGVKAIDYIRQGDIKTALVKLAEMGEGIMLLKKLLDIK